MKWFRFHTEALDDPKVQRLPPHLFKTWVNLLCVAGQNGGKLPGADDLAFKLRLSAQDMEHQINELILTGLLDISPDKSVAPHNWSKRQYASDDSKTRVRKHRELNKKTIRNDNVTVTVTPPDTEQTQKQIQKTDSETAATPVPEPASPSPNPAALPSPNLDLKVLETKLLEACNGSLDNPVNCMGLLNLATPQMWLANGCDLELDVLPALTAAGKKYHGKRIRDWSYFTGMVADAKAKRTAPMPVGEVGAAAKPSKLRPFAAGQPTMAEVIARRKAREIAAEALR